MEEALSFPSQIQKYTGDKLPLCCVMTRSPGWQGRQSREETQVPVFGWRKGPPLSSRYSVLLLWLVKIMEMGKSQKCSRGCPGLSKKPEEYDL